MRIAVVTEYYYPTLGGVQEHVFHFAREVRRQGHTVTIVTGHMRDLPPASPEAEEGVLRIGHSLPVEANGSVGRVTVAPDLGLRLRELLTEKRFDLVHVHAPFSPVLPMLAIRNTALPVVGTFHTNFTRSRLMTLLRQHFQALLDRVDANIAVSNACIHAIAPYVRGDFRIIPNGVDCAYWEQGRPRAKRGRGKVVLFVGRLETRNGLDRLLRAWPLLPKGLASELLVLGEGPERRWLESLAQELNVPARFLGAVRDERADWFASADLLVCPMAIASFGVTLLEGMAAGLPVIASDIDGFCEVLTDGREGWLVDTANPALLADRMAVLLEDPRLRARFGAAGHETAARYDWSKISTRVLDVYREVGARA